MLDDFVVDVEQVEGELHTPSQGEREALLRYSFSQAYPVQGFNLRFAVSPRPSQSPRTFSFVL